MQFSLYITLLYPLVNNKMEDADSNDDPKQCWNITKRLTSNVSKRTKRLIFKAHRFTERGLFHYEHTVVFLNSDESEWLWFL
jgi:hypothetical protein